MHPAISLRERSLATLVAVSLFGVAFETFLTRYFALALFSDYSYWIISMAMLGYAAGGVLLAIWPERFLERREAWLSAIPPLLLLATVIAFVTLRLDPFNPLKLQNPELWRGQVPAVLGYYAGLALVFLLAGMLIGLTFLSFQREIPVIYALDLLGAAAGAALVLAALFLVHPYHLPVIALGLLLALTVLNAPGLLAAGSRWLGVAVIAGSAVAAALGGWLMLSTSELAIPEFKPLHGILAIAGTKIERRVLSPSGSYLVVDDYTEFDDVNMTNNYTSLGIGAPPRSWGLYKDGTRVSPLVKELPADTSYVGGALSHFPLTIRPSASVLLVGTSGGYQLLESGPDAVGLEQQRTSYALVRDALAGAGAAEVARLQNASVFAYLRGRPGQFGIIELAWDLLGQDPTNRFAFTREAMALYLRSLAPGGIVLVPVDISEVTLYCLKMAGTVQRALRDIGVEPGAAMICYRSQWTCEIMASNRPFSASDIAALRRWCSERSFDTSWFPGIDPAGVEVWNDLPPVSYESGEVAAGGSPQDALMQDLVTMIRGGPGGLAASRLFNFAPPTLDRPDFYSISRPSRIGALLPRASLLPQQEMSYLVNVVVLAQALVLAAVVLVLPMAARRRAPGGRPPGLRLRVVLYFAALGIGFFFIELALIDRLSFLLGSATASFGVVLAAMLVFSGLGSWYTARFASRARRGLAGALAWIVPSLLFYLLALDPLMRFAIALPLGARVALTVGLVAPASFGLGRPFALGTSELAAADNGPLIPWAWSLNGAASIVATPVANLLSASVGWTAAIVVAAVLYLSILLTFPGDRRFGILGGGRTPTA